MFKVLEHINNWTFEQYLQYKQEIALDIQEMLFSIETPLVQESILVIGKNKLHHMIEFHQDIFINFLYFKNRKILEDYLFWIYRVYYHRNLDLDFLHLFFSCFQKVLKKYLQSKSYSQLSIFYEDILAFHQVLLSEIPKEKPLVLKTKESEEFTEALLHGDRTKTLNILTQSCPTWEKLYEFFSSTFHDSMEHIGYLWEINQITVAKQHLASTTIDDTIFTLLEKFEQEEPKNKTIFFSTAPLEAHGLGNKIITKIAQKKGYSVINIGANLPTNDIIGALNEFTPNYIIFSATLTTSPYYINEILEKLKKYTPSHPYQTIISGYGLRHLEDPKENLKADFYCQDMKKLLDVIENF